jgi:hypothetical protein
MKITTEKITTNTGSTCYFVAVYVNGHCIGTCLTDGTLTAQECYNSVKNNHAIDEMEKISDLMIDSQSNY